MEKNNASLVEEFQRYFSIEQATTPAQLENVYRVRYRVYCEEFQYETPEAFPNQLETDEFDANSRHSLVVHKASGMPAGCARLVLADEQRLMPMEKYCAHAMDESIIRGFDGRRDTICEFSRLGVDGAFRRRPGERESRFGEIAALDCSKREQRTFPLVALATILSALAMSELIGRPHCFAMMEPFLPRLLGRSGLIPIPAGKETEYHGTRSPFYWDTRVGVSNLAEDFKAFYAAIRADFTAAGAASARSTPVMSWSGRAEVEQRAQWPHFFRAQYAI
ncbi:MAG: PEP-CTERM/exosortase system-associated acyltransferase [Haliea sp.]|nr:PEP-CTERM/exosortase system-associated acyltransferase [Haliea sp.]